MTTYYGDDFGDRFEADQLMARLERAARQPRPFACQECGRRMTTREAERYSFSDEGCPGCGSSDIDLAE